MTTTEQLIAKVLELDGKASPLEEWEFTIVKCGLNAAGKQMWAQRGPVGFESHAKADAEFVSKCVEAAPALAKALEAAITALEKIHNRGAGPIQHRLEVGEALAEIERLAKGPS